jgi:hypothetical protein
MKITGLTRRFDLRDKGTKVLASIPRNMAANQPHQKVKRGRTSQKYGIKQAVTQIPLDLANAGKLEKLEALAVEYRRVTQWFCDLLIE